MRIARLDLYAFGPFTNARLDFSRKPGALQLVYGPNEAGKSTTLRAVTALLYGIPVRTQDAHLHEMTRLRIGATLTDERGKSLHIVRRKGAKHTLLDAKDEPVGDDALLGMLGGLDETLFRQMFGLDHERLREGAEALLSGGGRVGEGLFDAGTGARTIRSALDALRAEVDELYKPRGRTPKLNAAIESLRERQREQKEAALSPQAYVEQQRALEQARAARERAFERRRSLLTEKARLTRALSLLPLLARHASLEQELAQADHRTASAHAPSPVLFDEELEKEVRELDRRYGSVLGAERELPRRQNELAALEREIASLRARLGNVGSDSRSLDTPARARVRKLAEEEEDLRRELRDVERQLETLAVERAELEERLIPARNEPAHEQSSQLLMRELVERIDREDPLGVLLRLDAELARRDTAIRRALHKLGSSVSLAGLSTLVLPDEAALRELEEELAVLDRDQERTRAELSTRNEELARLARTEAELLVEGEPPTLAELERAREERDRALDPIARAARGSAPHIEAPVVEQYRHDVRRADELSDRLRHEARRASELQRVRAQRALSALERDQLGEAAEKLALARSALDRRCSALLAPSGFSGLSLRAARPKLVALGGLLEQAAEHAALASERLAMWNRARELTGALAGTLGEPSEDDPAKISELLSRARHALEQVTRRERELDALRQRVRELELSAAAHLARKDKLRAMLATWRTRFSAELSAHGLDLELSTDELLACLDELSQLHQKQRERDALEKTIAAVDADARSLTQDLRALCERVLPEAKSLTAQAALEALSRRLQEAREGSRDKQRIEGELHKLKEQLTVLGDGATLPELRAFVADVEPDSARARLSEIDPEIEALAEEIGAIDRDIGRSTAGMEVLEEASGAVQLAEDVESELSTVRALTRRYVEARLALAILSREVERYRAEHQGPVLARASELFPRLTVNRYTGLDVEYDERDEPVLCCVRADAKTVRVSGLSDGTRDQLYLALRVASIERFLSTNPPLPLVLDDAFVHFDDQRAEAALKVLGELCASTQVLFFTHHARMVEIAKRALGRERLMLHELDPSRGVINARDDGPLFSRI